MSNNSHQKQLYTGIPQQLRVFMQVFSVFPPPVQEARSCFPLSGSYAASPVLGGCWFCVVEFCNVLVKSDLGVQGWSWTS